MKDRTLTGALLIFASATGFGFMPILATYAYRTGMNPLTLLLIRFAMAAVLLFGLVFLRGERRRLTRRALMSLVLLGAVLYMLQSFLYFSSVRYISPALAVLLLYLYPVFVITLSLVVDRIRLSRLGAAAMAISLCGVAIVLGRPSGTVNALGAFLALSSGVVYAIYIVYGNRIAVGASPVSTTAYVSMFASLSFLVVGLSFGQVDLTFRWPGWFVVAAIAVVCTVVAIVCFFAGLARVGANMAALVSMWEPVVAVLAAAVLLGADLSPTQVVGAVLVLTGAVLGVATLRSRTPES